MTQDGPDGGSRDESESGPATGWSSPTTPPGSEAAAGDGPPWRSPWVAPYDPPAQHGAAPYAPPPYSEEPYAPPYGGQPYAPPPYLPAPDSPGHRRRIGLIVAGTVVVVVLVVVAVVASLAPVHHARAAKNVASAASPSAAPSSPGGASSGGSGSNGSSASGPLDAYVLSPAEVGSGAQMVIIDGGRDVRGQATLDWCNYNYTSEQQRTARLQVDYEGGGDVDVSNEVVRYQSGGAAAAYAEIQKAASSCPASFQEYGATISQAQTLPQQSSFTSKQLTIVSLATAGDGQEWTEAVYQFDGNYFSGVYVDGADQRTVEQQAAALGAKAAKHLQELATGKPGTGGGVFSSPLPDNGSGGGGAQT